jgi:membrane protease YdiL (CAAX protease family)
VTLPPPGWHPDPGQPSRLRYWDGETWTTWVSEDGQMSEAAVPDRALGIQRWPAQVVWVCMAGLLAITVAVALVYLVVAAVAGRSPELLVAVTFPVQYALMYVLVRRLSQRYGTGRVVEDLRWRVERRDIWPGIGSGLLALVATAIVVNVARTLLDLPVEATDQFGSLDDTTATRLMIAVAAVIGAPLFEELVFRGVVLHALLRWGWTVAVVGSSMLFGLTHLNPELGISENAVILVSTTTTGCVLAWVAHRSERLGPSMVAHASFNLIAVTLLFTT